MDLAIGGGLAETAWAPATAEGLPHREDEVLALARVALESRVVKRAVASGKLWREVPVAAPLEGGVVEGFIDHLEEEKDGLFSSSRWSALTYLATHLAGHSGRLSDGLLVW